jgi:hypothetical protein
LIGVSTPHPPAFTEGETLLACSRGVRKGSLAYSYKMAGFTQFLAVEKGARQITHLIIFTALAKLGVSMSQALNDNEVKAMKASAESDVKKVLQQLEKDYPGITEGLSTAVGAGLGGAGSLAALSALGTSGLSAAGITSGLATAGSIVGGGMVAGIGVLAAPVAILGVTGYAIAKKRKSAKLATALGLAIARLYDIQSRLIANAEYFKEEIASIKAVIDTLSVKKAA